MSRDYEEFIAALNDHRVRYLIVGAHAVAFHARPRATKDLDVFYEPTPGNARRLLQAIRDFFGGASVEYSVEELTDPRWVFQFGIAPVRIDLLPSLKGGPDFATAWKNRSKARFADVETCYVGLDDLIRAKQAADRPQDRADVRVLQRRKKGAKVQKRKRNSRGK